VITIDELSNGITNHVLLELSSLENQNAEMYVQDIMKNADLNGDQMIDFQEFVTAAVDSSILMIKSNINAIFRILDVDDNGYIDRDELMQQFKEENADLVDEIIKEADTDNDNRISAEEFRAAIGKIFKKL